MDIGKKYEIGGTFVKDDRTLVVEDIADDVSDLAPFTQVL
jgi:hypothetical protein